MNLRKLLLVIITFAGFQIPCFAQEIIFPVPTGNSKQLFYLQRTRNINTIVYEPYCKNGMIDPENPVRDIGSATRKEDKRKDSVLTKKICIRS
jgi:hypothetical protein